MFDVLIFVITGRTILSREITPNSKTEAHGMEMTSFAPEKFSGGAKLTTLYGP